MSGTAGTDGGSGGSGGSVLIQTSFLRGEINGSISANGGAGSSAGSNPVHFGGGGSGGRIAIYYSSGSWNGNITAYGGNLVGSQVHAGGPGTIYIEDQFSDLKKKLIIDNGGLNNMHGTPPIIDEVLELTRTRGTVAWLLNETLYEFDEVRVAGNADLAIESAGSVSIFNFFHFSNYFCDFSHTVLDIANLTGDHTGMLHVRSNQLAQLSTLIREFEVSIYAYPDSTVFLPESVSLCMYTHHFSI